MKDSLLMMSKGPQVIKLLKDSLLMMSKGPQVLAINTNSAYLNNYHELFGSTLAQARPIDSSWMEKGLI
jgi:hypothetical protein